jgi:ABC-type uncharacterized transport system auxiliary subunit
MRGAMFALSVGLLGGCALTTKATPVELRYFSPESFVDSDRPAAAGEPIASPPLLRLARVDSSEQLRGRIAYRESAQEVGSYETLRWTENPENYVRRALHRALFERGRLSEVVSGPAAVLTVELIAFEDVRRPTGHTGRVVLYYSLRRGDRVLSDGRVQMEHAAEGDGIEATVTALGLALEAAVERIGDDVATNLANPE